VSLGVAEKIKLFDSLVLPILCYGSEIWGLHKAPDIERVYVKFLKQLLNVKQQTINATVYGELGLFPLSVIRKVRIIKYWSKILQNPDSLLYKIMCMKDNNDRYVNDWTIEVKNMLNEIGFGYVWTSNNINTTIINQIVQRIHDTYVQLWFAQISSYSKLDTYSLFKTSFAYEKYLDAVSNKSHRECLTRLRCSSHKLFVEEGRYRNIDRNERICKLCNMNVVENEFHFLLVCPFYRELRITCLPKYYNTWPTIQKFKNIVETKQKSLLVKLAKFIFLANKKRDSFI
jgi:hypothetical protein